MPLKPDNSGFLSLLAGCPGAEGFLHIRVREKRDAQVAKNRTLHNAVHIGTARYLLCVDADLRDMATSVGDGRAVDDAVEIGPQRVGHAHGAGCTGGVHRVAGEAGSFEFFASKADRARFAMSA